MNVLKIIFFGLLAFIERHPIFCTIIVLLAIFAPFVFEVLGWILLGIVTLILILFGVLAWKMYKMKREMKKPLVVLTSVVRVLAVSSMLVA